MHKKSTPKVPLTPMQKRWLVNFYVRGLLSRDQIKHFYGYTLEELRPTHKVSEEHYLIKCPKCESSSVAMKRHYSNYGAYRVSAVCRDCGSSASGRDYLSAMVRWNKEEIQMTH